jgi:hypothetical protein
MTFLLNSLPFLMVLVATSIVATAIGLFAEGIVARLRLGWNASDIFNGPRKA